MTMYGMTATAQVEVLAAGRAEGIVAPSRGRARRLTLAGLAVAASVIAGVAVTTAHAGQPPAPPGHLSKKAVDGYRTYTLALFGLSDQIPAALSQLSVPLRIPAGGGGISFRTPGGVVSMTVLADPNDDSQSAAQVFATMKKAAGDRGSRITYSSIDGAVAIVSGYQNRGTWTFYQRDVVTPTVIYSLAWRFPTTLWSIYSPEVDHTAQTFAPGQT
jgi:hypothetical protein